MSWLRKLLLCRLIHEHRYDVYDMQEAGGMWYTVWICRYCGRRLYI